MGEREQKPVIQESSAEYQLLMDLRQCLLGMVAAMERFLGRKPTTAQKVDYWKQYHTSYSATHADYPDWETTET